MNFRKASIFDRGKREFEFEAEAQDERGGILAVWGSPGSGKTVTAVKLAKLLAEKKHNVALLLCDTTAPMLPCVCPSSELESARSLRSIFGASSISVNLIKHNCCTHKRLSHLTLLGLLKGESEYSMAEYTQKQASDLLSGLREIAPYVIVDCGSYIANDILSAVALLEADSVLSLISCELKTVSYYSGQLKTLQASSMDMHKLYKVASNIKPGQSPDHIGKVLGAAVFKLPHSPELEQQYLDGQLLSDLSLKDSRAYRKELEKILREVFGC